MKKDLLDSIYNQIKQAVTGYTSTDVYYTILPNVELLKGYSIVYNVSNAANVDSFDTKERLKFYLLSVQINNTQSQPIIESLVFIKAKLLILASVNNNVHYINVTDEDLAYDFDLKIFTGIIKFNLWYSL
jgi:hypothetical protein